MLKRLIISSSTALALTVPFFAFAATPTFGDILRDIGGLVTLGIWLVGWMGLLFFFWGLTGYVLNSGDSKKQEEGRRIMVWGLLTLFVMFSIGGLIFALQETFGLDGNDLDPFDRPAVQDVGVTPPQTLTDIIRIATSLLTSAVWVLQAAALAAFLWGVGQFILHAGNTEKRKKAQATLIWGILILTLFFSFNAVILIIERTFLAGGSTTTSVPGGVDHTGDDTVIVEEGM
jgi:phosphate starvation-inducible membrane PsiE